MKNQSLKEKIKKIANLIELGLIDNDEILNITLINEIYEYNKENTLKLFLKIQEFEHNRLKKENNKYYKATVESLNIHAHLSMLLLEEKTSRQAKNYVNYILNSDNIASIIDVCKVIFPKGNAIGHNKVQIWFFDKFVNMIKNNLCQYQKGGKSRKWADNFDHTEYIDKIIELHINKK